MFSIAACGAGPIAWDEQLVPLPARGDESAETVSRFPGQCRSSVRAWTSKPAAYAVWWAVRPDSTADIVASVTTNGIHWSAPVKVDTVDVGRVGCDRPPPSLFADGDNLHVVYSMTAKEGPGVFLAHSMDRARTLHSPVAVVYGARPAMTSVAAEGNLVVVAYEDPNTTPTRISVALSTTMAHLFEFRESVSPPDGAVSAPWVHLDGRNIEVSWNRAGDSHDRTGKRGTIR